MLPFDIQIIRRSNRKNATITISPNGEVRLLAPTYLKTAQIDEIIQGRSGWIQKKLKENEARPKAKEKSFEENDTFLYLGNTYQLRYSTQSKHIHLDESNLVVPAKTTDPQPENKSAIKKAIETWYRNTAKDIIEDRVHIFEHHFDKKPQKVKIKAQKSRWGSCSSAGNLNFNWVLIMASLPIIDYVVVHELSHLIHHNHSRKFWNLVETVMPDYKQHKTWLNKNGQLLKL